MSLFEVQVLKGEVSLFNPDRDNKPGVKTYANDAEMVGIYDINLANKHASLEFFRAMIVLNCGKGLCQAVERELPDLNSSTVFELTLNNLPLCSINVILIANL